MFIKLASVPSGRYNESFMLLHYRNCICQISFSGQSVNIIQKRRAKDITMPKTTVEGSTHSTERTDHHAQTMLLLLMLTRNFITISFMSWRMIFFSIFIFSLFLH